MPQPVPPDMKNLDSERQRQVWQLYVKSSEVYKQQTENHQHQIEKLTALHMRKSGSLTSNFKEEKQYKPKKKNLPREDQEKLHRHWSVGVRVEIDLNGKKKTGTITSFDESTNEYEVTCDDGSICCLLEDYISVLAGRKHARSETPPGEKSKKRRSASPKSDDSSSGEDADAISSNESFSGKNAILTHTHHFSEANFYEIGFRKVMCVRKYRIFLWCVGEDDGSNDQEAKKRRARRTRKSVAYFEWPSDSSSADSEEEDKSVVIRAPKPKSSTTTYDSHHH